MTRGRHRNSGRRLGPWARQGAQHLAGQGVLRTSSHRRTRIWIPMRINRHRSHFGSRYRLGCCGNAGLFAPARRARMLSHRPAVGMRLKQPRQATKRCFSSPGLVSVSLRSVGLRRAWDCWKSCKLCGWLALAKQRVCKGPQCKLGGPGS